MCSLNWGDLFTHFHDTTAGWARDANLQISAAYAAASFLALEPCLPMPGHPDLHPMPPVALPARPRRDVLAPWLAKATARVVLVAFGGIPMRLPVEAWAQRGDLVWLVPEAWSAALAHPACHAFEPLGLPFADLLASVDAILTKPGYGTFVEAAANGTPVLYLRRGDWPEQDALIAWLHGHARARELSAAALAAGTIGDELELLWAQPAPPRPRADGAERVADWLLERLRT
jgi:hypothetical protein